MSKFLKEDQVKLLEGLNWDVKPEGAFLTLIKSDFHKSYVWDNICSATGQNPNNDHIQVLFIGSK
jgi:hypothetical protein